MENDRNLAANDGLIEPEDVNSAPVSSTNQPVDPNDEIPVPIAMYPAEIDERAQVVEALREESGLTSTDDLRPQP